MPTLNIYLQRECRNDRVQIHVSGRPVFHQENVSADLLIGLADSVEVEVPAGQSVVEIALPERDLRSEILVASVFWFFPLKLWAFIFWMTFVNLTRSSHNANLLQPRFEGACIRG